MMMSGSPITETKSKVFQFDETILSFGGSEIHTVDASEIPFSKTL